MAFEDYLVVRRIATSLELESKEQAMREVGRLLSDDGLDAAEVASVLEAREALASTGVGSGVAIPHGRIAGLSEVRAALALVPDGVPFDAIDGEPVRIIVGVLAPEEQRSKHLRVLADVSRVLRSGDIRRALLAADGPEQALAVLQKSA